MNDIQLSFYYTFTYGVVSIIFFHNLFISINHHRDGRLTISILKIIFNLSGTIEPFLLFLLEISSYDLTTNTCKAIYYIFLIIDLLFRESLVLVVLWRLKLITDSKLDKLISVLMILLRTCFQISFIILANVRPTIFMGRNFCMMDNESTKIPGRGIIGTDLLIDIYVTIRMFQILTEGSRNADQVDSITGRAQSNRKLFTAVIRWNYLRLASVILYNALTITLVIPELVSIIPLNVLRMVNLITLSYLITMDKEIVRVIAGTNNDFDETENVRIIYDYTINNNSRYSVSITKNNKSPKRSISKVIKSFNNNIELDVNIIQSKQKLTFVEWACMVGWDIQELKDIISERPERPERPESDSTLEIVDE